MTVSITGQRFLTLTRLEWLFSPSAAVTIASSEMHQASVWPEEQVAIAAASFKRQQEFAAGRGAARQALSRFGISPRAIPMKLDRSPTWPPGFVGSIAHCDGMCVAVAGRRRHFLGLGVDIEPLIPALSSELESYVFGKREASCFLRLPKRTKAIVGKLTFCAKEAFYKCYYPLYNRTLDFRDISVRFSANQIGTSGLFVVDSLKSNLQLGVHKWSGRWIIYENFILAGVELGNFDR